MYKQLF